MQSMQNLMNESLNNRKHTSLLAAFGEHELTFVNANEETLLNEGVETGNQSICSSARSKDK